MTTGHSRDESQGDGDPLGLLREHLAERYDIGEEIGRGGMAAVYQAVDRKHQRTVALKVLHPELAVAVGAVRFLREIQLEARLNHPHILSLIDSGHAGHFLYYLAPWADGGTLRDRLVRETQLSLDEALRIVGEIGDALTYAHRAGIVHRDVKPENILFNSGHALLADFGIAHALADTDAEVLTDSGLAVGTPAYMSPEQAMPDGVVDARTDEYALACILFEMLSGDPPFTGRSTQAILARQMTERPPSLTVVRPDLPLHVVSAINRALEKAAAGRFESVERFVAALQPSAAVVGPAPVSRRWLRWAMSAAAAAVAAAAASLWPARGPPLAENKVAVFPLATRGLSGADSGVGVGVAYLLEAALEGAAPLRLIDVGGRLTPAQLGDPLAITDRAANRVGRSVGAAHMLQGVVQGHQDSTTVILRLYDVEGDSLIRQASASGLTGATPLHHLGIDALKTLLPSLIDPTRKVDFTPLRDRRPQAIALWMQGERHYRLSQFDSAGQFYDRALADDSALALAAIKGAQAASWTHRRARSIQLVEHALRSEALLPRKYALLARGLRSYLGGEGDSAVAMLQEAQLVDPDWAEPAAARAEVYIHLLPSERPLDSLAHAALLLALDRDSAFTTPLFHLAEAAINGGRLDEADRIIRRLGGAEPALRRQLTLMRECIARPSREPWQVAGPPGTIGLFDAAKSLSAGARQPECAEAGFRTVLRTSYSTDAEKWGAMLALSGLLLGRGAFGEAAIVIDSAVTAGKGVVRTFHVLGAIAGAPMRAAADSLTDYARVTFGEHFERMNNPESLWLMLAWSSFTGHGDRVRMIADTFGARAALSGDPRVRMFASAALAHVALARFDTSDAIARLQRLPPPGAGADLPWRFGDAVPIERLLLARLLERRGRYRESLLAASVFDHADPISFLPFVGESLAIRYRAALALGQRGAADSFRARLQRLDRQDLIRRADTARR